MDNLSGGSNDSSGDSPGDGSRQGFRISNFKKAPKQILTPSKNFTASDHNEQRSLKNYSGSHRHGGAHDGCAHHNHSVSDVKTMSRLIKATGINVLLSGVMVAGAVYSSSVSLAADALHNLSDALALVIAFAALKWSRKPANSEFTFGYASAEAVGTLVNTLFLFGTGLFLLFEAVERWFQLAVVRYDIMMAIAAVALVIDLWTVWLLWKDQHTANLKAAMLHNISDAMASVVVLISGYLGQLWAWARVDSLATVLISFYIFKHSWPLLKESLRRLMNAAPLDFHSGELIASALKVFPEITSLHHVHIWQISEKQWAFEAHVEANLTTVQDLMALKTRMKKWLASQGLQHSTLEFEDSSEKCVDLTHINS